MTGGRPASGSLLRAVDRENLYPTTAGDEDLRALANAVRESPSGRWSSTIKEHVSRRREQVTPDRQRVAPDRQQFAEQVLRAMEPAGVPHARIDRENFAILHESNGDPQVLNLGPTFIECQHASPEQVSERIAKLVSFATASDGPFDTWDSVRDLLRPVLRAATYGLDVGQTDGMWPLARPAVPFLQERVVIDRPTSMQYVMDSHPADCGDRVPVP